MISHATPSSNPYQHPTSFHSRPSLPFFLKQFSSPPFRRLETFGRQRVPVVGRGRHPSSMTHNSNLAPFPATPTSSSSILWGPSVAGTSTSSPTYGNRATSTKSDVLSYSDKDATTCLRDFVSLHGNDPKGRRSSEFEDRVAQVIKRVTGEGVSEGDATRKFIAMPARTPNPSPTSPSTLFSSKRQYASLSPPFRRFKTFRGQRLSRSRRGASMIGDGHRSPSSAHQLTPSISISHQRQLDTQSEHLSTFPSQATPTIESHSNTALLTPNTQTRRLTLSPASSITTSPLQRQPLKTCPPFRLYRDEQPLRGDPTPPIALDNAGDTSLSSYNTPPISPSALASDLSSPIHDSRWNSPPAFSCDPCQYPAPLHRRPSPLFSPKRRCSSSPPSFCQLKNTRKERLRMPLSQTALLTKHKDCTVSDLLTPDSNTLSLFSKTCHLYPDR